MLLDSVLRYGDYNSPYHQLTQEKSTMIQLYAIKNMHCHSCTEKIKAALEPLTTHIEISLEPPQAKLTLKTGISLQTLNDTLAHIGDYRLTPIQEDLSLKPPTLISWLRRYYPLILIFFYISIVSLLSAQPMHTFMAGFFLVFSGFKLLDLPGFAKAYATYDLLAKRSRLYAFTYPFLELGLGIAYLTHWQTMATYSITIAIMGFSSLGVINALANKQKIQCACLGTVLNLPMTVITLIEDLAMLVMAVILLSYPFMH